jgi:hypothetical protein
MAKKIKEKYKDIDWTRQARKILKGLDKFPENSSIGIILRHSHRYKIKNPEKSSKIGLTQEGKEFAKFFGNSLPESRPIYIYHSIVQRCKETALKIQSGLKRKYQNKSLKGELKVLSDLNAEGVFVANEMMKHSGEGFLMKWKEGYYPITQIMNFDDYYQKAAEEIWNNLARSKESSLNLYITHDLHLLSLRLGWFGLSPNKEWVSYLGGFAFSFHNEYILFFEGDQLMRMEYPHWWIDKNIIIKNKGGEKNGKKSKTK